MASSYNEDVRFCPSTCKQEDSVLKKTPVWGAFMKRCVFGARFHRIRVMTIREEGVMNGPLKFLTARKILPLLDLLAKFKRVLACSCSPNFCVARKLAKQFFYFCSCSQKNRSSRHARECSQRPFVTPWGRGPRGYSTKFYTGRLCPEFQPRTILLPLLA